MGSTIGSNIFGGVTFALIIALALAAVAVMIYGRYLKQRRVTGEKELIERREAAHVDAVVIEPDAPLATVEPVAAEAVEVAAAPVAKAKAKAVPKPKAVPKAPPAEPSTKAAAKPKAAPAPRTKAVPKAAAAAPAAAPKAEPAPKAKAAPKPKVEAAAPAASPKVEPAPAPTAATEGDITQLKGLGPKLAATLAELGYTRLDQIAALTPGQAAELDAKLGAFQGRMARDRWIEQATLLVAGDRAAYEAAFGKLG